MRLEYFEMIDTVEVMDFDEGVVRVVSTLPEESPVFDGHFPKFPVLPGVLMLEVMNHAMGYLLYRRFEKKRFVFLGGIRRAKFRRFVKPGAELTIHGKITHDGSGFHVAETSVVVNDEVASDAEIVMLVSDFPNDVLEDEMRRRSELIRVLTPAGS
jgi:3-hydroxyacyl-[acyl-carrier-protein] dehydratase